MAEKLDMLVTDKRVDVWAKDGSKLGELTYAELCDAIRRKEAERQNRIAMYTSRYEKFSGEELDDAVDSCKKAEATALNSKGRTEQIGYLVECAMKGE